MAKIYLASSWRNTFYPQALAQLRAAGHGVYDFRNPETAFSWDQVAGNKDWKNWSVEDYFEALQHPRTRQGFNADFNAMQEADVCVLLLPCGKSAHIEAGWMVGQGKETYIVLGDTLDDADLMYLMTDGIVKHISDVIEILSHSELKEEKSSMLIGEAMIT